MENNTDDMVRLTAARGIAFQRFRQGMLTQRDFEQRLAELKLREESLKADR